MYDSCRSDSLTWRAHTTNDDVYSLSLKWLRCNVYFWSDEYRQAAQKLWFRNVKSPINWGAFKNAWFYDSVLFSGHLLLLYTSRVFLLVDEFFFSMKLTEEKTSDLNIGLKWFMTKILMKTEKKSLKLFIMLCTLLHSFHLTWNWTI